MLRLSEVRLPLDHTPEQLDAAVCAKLDLPADRLPAYTVFKRGYDARKRGAIVLVYTLDVDTPDEAALLERFASDIHVSRTPDMRLSLIHI